MIKERKKPSAVPVHVEEDGMLLITAGKLTFHSDKMYYMQDYTVQMFTSEHKAHGSNFLQFWLLCRFNTEEIKPYSVN